MLVTPLRSPVEHLRHSAAMGRSCATVCRAIKEWARDDDGDGIREVHNNTLEGLWTGLRNSLRPFRRVTQFKYINMFYCFRNVKRATAGVVRALLGVKSALESRLATIFRHEHS